MLLQATHDNHRHNTLNTPNTNRDSAAVDGIRGSLVLAHPKLGRKSVLVPGVLQVQSPSAAPPAERAGALALDPDLVVRVHTTARGCLEDGHAVGEGDGDEGGARVREQTRVEEVAELVGIGSGEGL